MRSQPVGPLATLLATSLAVSFWAGDARALFTGYTSSATFFTDAGAGVVTETYEGLALGTVITDGSTVNGITYSSFPASTDGLVIDDFANIDTRSLGATRTDFPTLKFFFPGESFTVTFSAPVTAVGLYFNIGSSTTETDYVYVSTPEGTVSSGGATPDTGTFFFAGGISTVPFTTATFGATSTAPTGFNVDNLAFQPIPEPGSIVLITLGLAGLAVRRRRSR